MRNSLKKTIGIVLSFSMILTMAPAGMVWAVDDGSVSENKTEASGYTEASASVISEEIEQSQDEIIDNEEIDTKDEKNDIEANAIAASVLIDENIDIKKGTLQYDDKTGTITATPKDGYDLATIRAQYSDNEEYICFNKVPNKMEYTADFAPSSDCTITAFFMSTTKWDGAVDISWYDPDAIEYEIKTPAMLAGLAAITNGMVDENVTEEYMIKDNEGRKVDKDGSYSHEYISTYPEKADLLTPNSSTLSVRDTVWRLPEVEKDNKIADDDTHHDFLYRTIKITEDIDMGDCNWTPIGGKYAMNPEENKDGDAAKVIDTRFQGVFDGQGHTITVHASRQSKMGYPYSWEVALVGYLGGGIDYKNGYPKDTYAEYKKHWVPTVRNVVVRGEIKGRRLVGGIVGRTGETKDGVLVEKCANFATIYASDMRGCAGIVGGAWGKAEIRNCYNAGDILTTLGEQGGIVGYNGYEGSGSYEGRTDFKAAGADIYNCYNIGRVCNYDSGTKQYYYEGHDIGLDGEAFASYTVANCYYKNQGDAEENSRGFCKGEKSLNARAKVYDVKEIENKDTLLEDLNKNGNVFVADTHGINDGYPILYFQDSYDSSKLGNVTISGNSNGNVTSQDNLDDVAYGATISLNTAPKEACVFDHFEITDGSSAKSPKYGNFYTVTGSNVDIKGVFKNNTSSVVKFASSDDKTQNYYVTVTRIYNANTKKDCKDNIINGGSVNRGDIIKISATLRSTKIDKDGDVVPVHPDLKTLEYTGEFSDAHFNDDSLEIDVLVKGTYKVTGNSDIVEITFDPKTQGKSWESLADTSWYKSGSTSFTINNAAQLAGLAAKCEDGVTFKGVTIKLGADIDLSNTKDNTGEIYLSERSWLGIGNDNHPFSGTFDGQGHSINYMHRNFGQGYCPGDDGGLFAVTKDAVIKNVIVNGGTYIQAYVDEYGENKTKEMNCEMKDFANGGGIVGIAINTKIDNCVSEVVYKDAYEAGGIVGTAEGNTIITNCTSNSTMIGSGNAIGGIVGRIYSSGGTQITNCVNNGSVSSSGQYLGGILGFDNKYGVTITNCTNNGTIELNTKYISDDYAVGGIIGYSDAKDDIVSCCNTGNIRGLGKTYNQAGIAGFISRSTISNCYNKGEIYSNSSIDSASVSGIANLNTNDDSISTIKNSYNTGNIVTGENYISTNAAGVVASSHEDNVVSNSYCSESSVENIVADEGTNKAGVAGTVVEDEILKTYASKLGSAFTPDVDNQNGGFPILKYQCQHELKHYSKKAGNCVTGYDYDQCTKCDTQFNYKTLAGYSTSYVKSFKLAKGKKCFTAKWKKQSKKNQKKFNGYQIQYSVNSNYSGAKTVSVGKTKSSKKISKLSAKKKYYVRIRTYRKVGGVTYYSKWTSKSVKTK